MAPLATPLPLPIFFIPLRFRGGIILLNLLQLFSINAMICFYLLSILKYMGTIKCGSSSNLRCKQRYNLGCALSTDVCTIAIVNENSRQY